MRIGESVYGHSKFHLLRQHPCTPQNAFQRCMGLFEGIIWNSRCM